MPAAMIPRISPTTRSTPAGPGSCRSSAVIIGCATISTACWRDEQRSERRFEMDFETYKSSLAEEAPPEGLSMAAQALWWEAKGDWHLAHQCAQKQPDAERAWAHAYLHRVEGDLRTAGGWDNRAGRPASTAPPKDEWATAP